MDLGLKDDLMLVRCGSWLGGRSGGALEIWWLTLCELEGAKKTCGHITVERKRAEL